MRLLDAWPIVLLCGVTVAAAGCLGGEAQPAPAPAAARLPLDPLSDEERALATALVMADPAVHEKLAGERYRVIGTALRVDKERTPLGDRLVDVWIYRYVSNDVVWPVVDLTRLRVESVDVHTYQPVLVQEELLEAEAVMLTHPEIVALLGSPAGVHHMAHLLRTDDGPCATHRCMEVRFIRGEAPLPVHAVFDLSTMEVLRVWESSGDDGEVA